MNMELRRENPIGFILMAILGGRKITSREFPMESFCIMTKKDN
jgi:hypothetical protein